MMPSLCSEFFRYSRTANENPMLPNLMDAMDSYAGLNMTLSKTKQRDLECFETSTLNSMISSMNSGAQIYQRMTGCSITHYISGGP